MVYGNDFHYRSLVQFQTSRLEAKSTINNQKNIPEDWNNIQGSRLPGCKHLSLLAKVITILGWEKKSRVSSVGLCCTILPHKSPNHTRKFLKVSNGKQQNKGKKKKKSKDVPDYKSQQGERGCSRQPSLFHPKPHQQHPAGHNSWTGGSHSPELPKK